MQTALLLLAALWFFLRFLQQDRVARDAERLVARKKELDDNPTPSGNSMLAYVLLRLSRIYGDDELERRIVALLVKAAGIKLE